MGRRSSTDAGSPTRIELEVFATGSTFAIDPHTQPPEVIEEGRSNTPGRVEQSTWSDRLRHGGELTREGIEHARDFHARPGHRPGAEPIRVGTTSSRAGGDTDIVRPVLVPPRFACDYAIDGPLFDQPIPHLSISHLDRDDEQRFLMWDAMLESGGSTRPVTFHLLASPSMLVTVLELVPCRRPRLHRQQFVADAVAAVEVIAHRLERAASSSRI